MISVPKLAWTRSNQTGYNDGRGANIDRAQWIGRQKSVNLSVCLWRACLITSWSLSIFFARSQSLNPRQTLLLLLVAFIQTRTCHQCSGAQCSQLVTSFRLQLAAMCPRSPRRHSKKWFYCPNNDALYSPHFDDVIHAALLVATIGDQKTHQY